MAAKKNRHVGLHAWRVLREEEEKKFAEAWRQNNEQGHVLDYLLNPHPEQAGRPVQCCGRDAQVAATVIQWLGSPVGQSFLEELGYKRKK